MVEILVPFFVPLPPSLGGDGVVVLGLPAVRARVVPQPVVHGPPQLRAVLMLAGATMMRTETLPIALYLNLSTGDLDMAVAAATILIAIS